MKNIGLLLVILTILSCNKKITETAKPTETQSQPIVKDAPEVAPVVEETVMAEQEYILGIGHAEMIADYEIELVLVAIEDMRCPVGEECEQDGVAMVIAAARTQDGEEELELTFPSDEGVGIGEVLLGDVVVSLTDVSPYPQAGDTEDGQPKTATFLVRKNR